MRQEPTARDKALTPHPGATTRHNELVRVSGFSQKTVTKFMHGLPIRSAGIRQALERICLERGIKFPVEAP